MNKQWILIQRSFCQGYEYGGKADISKTYWILKRKIWVTAHFSEIMKQPYISEKALKGKQSMAFFPKISSINFEKSEVATTIFFFDSDSRCYDLRFPHSHKPRKNSVLLEGKFLKKPDNEN